MDYESPFPVEILNEDDKAGWRTRIDHIRDELSGIFHWASSPQGFSYWYDLDNNLRELSFYYNSAEHMKMCVKIRKLGSGS